jgi:IS5 family transposase
MSGGAGAAAAADKAGEGVFILKHMHNLSDEVLCDRLVENPYFQYFCGEVVFRHEAPFDRSSLTRRRQRLGEEHITALLQESLSVAHHTGAIEIKDLERVAADTTVQEKAITHPSDARHAPRHQAGRASQARGRRAAAELSAARQAPRHPGEALHTCAPVQARLAPTQIPAHAARPIKLARTFAA